MACVSLCLTRFITHRGKLEEIKKTKEELEKARVELDVGMVI